jgi:hypothetical protein
MTPASFRRSVELVPDDSQRADELICDFCAAVKRVCPVLRRDDRKTVIGTVDVFFHGGRLRLRALGDDHHDGAM